METSLHRQLKALYGGESNAIEAWVEGYRIDVVQPGILVEIQASSLGAIRPKIKALVLEHNVLIVKPLAARKYLVKKSGRPPKVERRASPLKETLYHIFEELVYLVGVFPHPRLTIDVLLTEQEEHRRPIKHRWRRNAFRVEDRLLVSVKSQHRLRTNADLLAMLPSDLPAVFSTKDIASGLGIPRWLAQKMAYCLRGTGAITAVSRQRAGWMYQVVPVQLTPSREAS